MTQGLKTTFLQNDVVKAARLQKLFTRKSCCVNTFRTLSTPNGATLTHITFCAYRLIADGARTQEQEINNRPAQQPIIAQKELLGYYLRGSNLGTGRKLADG